MRIIRALCPTAHLKIGKQTTSFKNIWLQGFLGVRAPFMECTADRNTTQFFSKYFLWINLKLIFLGKHIIDA